MVMNKPHDHRRRISVPSNTNRFSLLSGLSAIWADRMDKICWATTDNTSMLMRLNSSKQPQAPVWAKPLNMRPSDL